MTEKSKNYKCGQCGAEADSKPDKMGRTPIPKGWKQVQAGLLCRACAKDGYVIRAVSFPVYPADARPLKKEDRAKNEDGTDQSSWDRLRATLRKSWDQSTSLANWFRHELMKADAVRLPDMRKLPPKPKLDLYKHYNAYYLFRDEWAGASDGVIPLIRRVQALYDQHRYDTLFLLRDQFPVFKYPFPFFVRAGGCKLTVDSRKRFLATISMIGGKVTVRLRQGPEFRRQIVALKQLISGEAKFTEASIDDNGEHVMLKLVGLFPKKKWQDATETMLICTDDNACLAAQISGQAHVWVVNADNIKREWVQLRNVITEIRHQHKSHLVRNQRMSQDLKHEKRWPKKTRARMVEAWRQRVKKHTDRINTSLHTIAKMIVNYAVRRKAGMVIYDDSCRGFFGEKFPYFKLKTLIEQKCDGNSVALNYFPEEKEECRIEAVGNLFKMIQKYCARLNLPSGKSQRGVSVPPGILAV